MRRGAYDPDGLLDAAYLIRMSGNLYAVNYAQAAGSAESDVRLQDWLTAECASQFFSAAFRGEGAESLGLYHVPRTSHQPSWPCFDDDRAYFRIRFGGLMRAAALHLCECQPQIAPALSGQSAPAAVFPAVYQSHAHGSAPPSATRWTRFCRSSDRVLLAVRAPDGRGAAPPADADARQGRGGRIFRSPRAAKPAEASGNPGNGPGRGSASPPGARLLAHAGLRRRGKRVYGQTHALALLAKGRKPAVDTPAAAFAAYTAALLDCTAQGTAGLPALQLPPPDSRGIDPNHHLLTLARNLPLADDAPFCDAPAVLAWETRLAFLLSLPYAQSVRLKEVIEWRGLMAVLLLWDGWELRNNLPELRCAPPPEGDGHARGARRASKRSGSTQGCTLFTVEKDVDGMLFEGPLGLLSPQTALLCAADPQKLYGLLPDCARWYDKDTKTFSDPCPFLNETDRARLIHRLKCLRRSPNARSLEARCIWAAARCMPRRRRSSAICKTATISGASASRRMIRAQPRPSTSARWRCSAPARKASSGRRRSCPSTI